MPQLAPAPAAGPLDALLAPIAAALDLVAWQHRDSVRVAADASPAAAAGALVLGDCRIATRLETGPSPAGGTELRVRFRVEAGTLDQAAVGLRLDLARWSVDDYLLLPAAVYNANRYPRAPHELTHERRPLREWASPCHDRICVTPVPRLHPLDEPSAPGEPNRWRSGFPGGPSRIQLLSGDCATPLVAVQFAASGLGLVLSTDQRTPAGETGLTIEENEAKDRAAILVQAPGVREAVRYNGRPSRDRGVRLEPGSEIVLRLALHVFPAADVPALFARVFELRTEYRGVARDRHELPFAAAWALQERKYNDQNWVEDEGYYSVGMRESPPQDWQTGWVGGPNAAYALLVEGDATTRARALRVWDFIAREARTPSGFVRSTYHRGRWSGDTCYLRYSADTLYFLMKTLHLLRTRPPQREIPPAWLELGRGLCDAFAEQFAREGRFVHHVDPDTGATIVGGSCAAGLAPAGLTLAAAEFDQPRYLQVAEGAARVYRDEYVRRGITNGGPGDIFQCIDSESAAALCDSFAVLYEATGSREWLEAGVMMAHQCATWTMSYDFAFPPHSTFGRLDMLTTGTVWANIQNKHSAPGICTLSGDGLFKLFRATGDRRILELIREVAHALPQYLSREDRPIVDRRPGQRWPVLPPGWMNERVNTSDWEVRDDPAEEIGVGEVFGGSCWSEAALLLTVAELPGVYCQTDTLLCAGFDHVHCQVEHAAGDHLVLALSNPTRFDARVKLLAERATDCARPLGPIALTDLPRIRVPAGATVRHALPR